MIVKGCDYCGLDESGDIPDEAKYLIDYKTIGRIGSKKIEMYAYVDPDRKTICTGLFLCGGSEIVETEKIHYCPICGRKL